jgi:hypothetical protein
MADRHLPEGAGHPQLACPRREVAARKHRLLQVVLRIGSHFRHQLRRPGRGHTAGGHEEAGQRSLHGRGKLRRIAHAAMPGPVLRAVDHDVAHGKDSVGAVTSAHGA